MPAPLPAPQCPVPAYNALQVLMAVLASGRQASPPIESFPLPSLRAGRWLGGAGWLPSQTGPGGSIALNGAWLRGGRRDIPFPRFQGGGGERERVLSSSALCDPPSHPENVSSHRAPALTWRSDVQARL